MTAALEAPTLADVEAARARIAGVALRTPLVRLDADARPAIYLKLENLQPTGSFKIRGAWSTLRLAPRETLARGVYTASAGNMAQGVAWSARKLGLRCTVIVPERAPETKVRAAERLGATIVRVSHEAWWRVLVEGSYPGHSGFFVHPVSNPAVIAGNGTIGLEILEDLPDVDSILVPYGGGGLSCGIAAAVRALRPGVGVYGCEAETAAPLAAALEAGGPREIEFRPSFVDGIGGRGILPEMWPLAHRLLEGARVASLDAIADAIRLLAERHRVIAEGAGAAPVAVARSDAAPPGTIVCVVSGGNLDAAVLARILAGASPD